MARPTFKIDQHRLRSMREESPLTQREVALKAHANLSLSAAKAAKTEKEGKNEESILRGYQRIEKTGQTSKSMATALAQVFGTTVEILQGGDVPEDSANVLSRVKQQLKEQIESGSNPTLLRAFETHKKTYGSPVSADECMADFAEEVGTQIEITQIGQNASDITRLAELTGWSAAQLRVPAGVNGHWLLLTAVHGSLETEIVLGANTILQLIRETVEKSMSRPYGDVHITLRRSPPWLYVDIVHAYTPTSPCKLSFVRCKPEANGLKWVNPTWRDQFWLEEPLKEWAFSNANFVTGFDGKNIPHDVRRLRFRVLACNANHDFEQVAYSKGNLDELPEQVLQKFQADGCAHSIVINWLANGFAQSLAPYLTAYPRKCWTIRPGTCHIAILLDIPFSLSPEYKDLTPFYGIKYSIDLVEEVSSGNYRPAPWRDSSVTEVCGMLEKRMFETPDVNDPVNALQFLSLPVSAS